MSWFKRYWGKFSYLLKTRLCKRFDKYHVWTRGQGGPLVHCIAHSIALHCIAIARPRVRHVLTKCAAMYLSVTELRANVHFCTDVNVLSIEANV